MNPKPCSLGFLSSLRYLERQHGFPMCIQRLVHKSRDVEDGATIREEMELQLILLHLACGAPDIKGKAGGFQVVARFGLGWNGLACPEGLLPPQTSRLWPLGPTVC